MSAIRLIVGLGNPGQQYEETRHNAGALFIEELARQNSSPLKLETKYHGFTCRINYAGQDVRLLVPTTFMNRSGQSVAALANFFKISPNEMLVAHDELDIAPGTARFKTGGGHGGHNGLRDIIAKIGSKDFHRLRLGIGHPGDAKLVSNYVLKKAPPAEHQLLMNIIDDAIRYLPEAVNLEWNTAMKNLHSIKPN